jgi:hypothetical protein
MKRQRVLERAGWTFWRCFASTFTLQRAEVLLDLAATLSRMGIVPIGAVTETVNRHTEHRIVEPAANLQLEEEAPAEASERQPEQTAKRNPQQDAFSIRDLFNSGRRPGRH